MTLNLAAKRGPGAEPHESPCLRQRFQVLRLPCRGLRQDDNELLPQNEMALKIGLVFEGIG